MGMARLSHNLSSDHSGPLKLRKSSSDLIFSNMDFLKFILVRLPRRKLMQFKCVSKSWLSFINTIPHPSGLFIQRPSIQHPFEIANSDPVFYFPLRETNNDSGVIRDLPTFCNYLFGDSCCPDSRFIRVLDSSHGLLLCSDCFLGPISKSRRDHYVYNPTTNQLATLPRPTEYWKSVCSMSMTLAFHPSNSPHYKVLACATMSQSLSPVRIRQFEIYSSETKSWRVSGQPFPQPDGIRFTNGVYCNGSVYWISELKSEIFSADCLFFDLNEERLKRFPKPPIRLTSRSRRSTYFGQSEDHLHFIEVSLHATSLHVYELKRDHSGWFVKYEVDLAQLSKAYPQNTNIIHDQNYYGVAVLSLVRKRDRFLEDDSLVVLDIPGKVIRYNLVTRNFEEICDHKVLVDQHTRNTGWRFGGLKLWEYVQCHLFGGLKVWEYVECHSSV